MFFNIVNPDVISVATPGSKQFKRIKIKRKKTGHQQKCKPTNIWLFLYEFFLSFQIISTLFSPLTECLTSLHLLIQLFIFLSIQLFIFFLSFQIISTLFSTLTECLTSLHLLIQLFLIDWNILHYFQTFVTKFTCLKKNIKCFKRKITKFTCLKKNIKCFKRKICKITTKSIVSFLCSWFRLCCSDLNEAISIFLEVSGLSTILYRYLWIGLKYAPTISLYEIYIHIITLNVFQLMFKTLSLIMFVFSIPFGYSIYVIIVFIQYIKFRLYIFLIQIIYRCLHILFTIKCLWKFLKCKYRLFSQIPINDGPKQDISCITIRIKTINIDTCYFYYSYTLLSELHEFISHIFLFQNGEIPDYRIIIGKSNDSLNNTLKFDTPLKEYNIQHQWITVIPRNVYKPILGNGPSKTNDKRQFNKPPSKKKKRGAKRSVNSNWESSTTKKQRISKKNKKDYKKKKNEQQKSQNKPQYNVYSKKYDHGNFLINTDIPWKDYKCNVPKYDIGKQTSKCEYCKAKFWHDERLSYKTSQKDVFGSLCCNYGKIDIPLPKELPPYLRSLFFGDTEEAKYFKDNIRAFNSLFTFATLKSKFNPRKQNQNSNSAPYVYRCEGVMYRWIGPLKEDKNATPVGLQVYMHDSDESIEYRCNMYDLENKQLAKKIIIGIQKEIEKYNTWIKKFKNYYEQNKNKKTKNISIIIESDPIIPKGRHKKQYSKPTNNQVAALVKRCKNSKKKQNRELILTFRGGGLKHINETHGMCDPATYPIFLPYGTEGWCKNSDLSGVTCLQYYRYLLYERDFSKNHMFKGQKLSQQYWVDMWVKIDQIRLNGYKTKTAQKKFRKYFISGADSNVCDTTELEDIDYPTILPSSYIGGPRYMNQRMHDALAIVRKYKKAHFFITMTIDPKSDEIVQFLEDGDSNSANRADIVRRVFEMKKKYLLYLIMHKHIFGKTVAHTYSIEFQKRGLPHIHLIVILDENSEPKTAAEYDKYISAQIPNKEKDKDLFDLVTKFMIHNNCQENRNCSCIQKGKCSKHFPKKFCNKTEHQPNGYVKHKRPSVQVFIY